MVFEVPDVLQAVIGIKYDQVDSDVMSNFDAS